MLVRIPVCIKSCLAIGWRTFIWRKNPPKCTSILVWIAEWWNSLLTSCNPKNNWCLARIFGVRFGEKDRGLSTCKPWPEQAGGLEAFLHGAAQNFKLLSNIQDQKLHQPTRKKPHQNPRPPPIHHQKNNITTRIPRNKNHQESLNFLSLLETSINDRV